MAENNSVEYKNISDLPTLESVDQTAWTPVEIAGKEGKKVDLSKFADKDELDGKADTAQMSISAVSGDSTKKTIQLKEGTSADVVVDHQDLSSYYTKSDADAEFVSKTGYVATDNNYTTTEKNKLAGIAAGAQKNVKPDWNAAPGTAAEILNKPTIPNVGTLTTYYAVSYTPTKNESLSGAVSLHKVSKTGALEDLQLNTSHAGECVLRCNGNSFSVGPTGMQKSTDELNYYDFYAGTADYIGYTNNNLTGIRIIEPDNSMYMSVDFTSHWYTYNGDERLYELDDVEVVRLIIPVAFNEWRFYDAYVKITPENGEIGAKDLQISFNSAFASVGSDYPAYDPAMEDTDEPLTSINGNTTIYPNRDGYIHIIGKWFEIIQP